MAAVTDFAANKALVLQRHRHLKWPWLDWLEKTLMILCGVCLGGFTLCVFCDVVTRELGYPWLWLQQATTAFFAWGVFIGIAAATRRNDHIYLAEITKAMTGAKRTARSKSSTGWSCWSSPDSWCGSATRMRCWISAASACPGSFRLTVYTGIVPISGALVMLFCVEQIVNGWQHGFEGPEDNELLTEPVT